MLLALQQRRVIEQRVAVVVAHPDDETIAAGASMHLMRRLLLVHVTDGAPRALGDAAREGFGTAQAYAAAREAELQAALALSGATPARERLRIADQDASEAIPDIASRLRTLFETHRIDAVLTHSYEGGHPDHDATALAVHLATADGPAVFEFAGYHAGPEGELCTQEFLEPSPFGRGLGEGRSARTALTPTLSRRERETIVPLSARDSARKRAMIACFRTQAAILSQFNDKHETFRAAPDYDWTAPPHAGPLNYENWGWTMTGAKWRDLARAALAAPCSA